MAGSRDVGELFAVEGEQFQFGADVVLVLRKELAASDAGALQYGVGLRESVPSSSRAWGWRRRPRKRGSAEHLRWW